MTPHQIQKDREALEVGHERQSRLRELETFYLENHDAPMRLEQAFMKVAEKEAHIAALEAKVEALSKSGMALTRATWNLADLQASGGECADQVSRAREVFYGALGAFDAALQQSEGKS